MRRSAFCLFLAAALTASADGADSPATKRILILGDSISIGYTPFVQKMLEGKATVVRPMRPNGVPENCIGTTAGVQHLDRWLQLEGGNWDVIHFNWGLHDLKHVKADNKLQASDLATDPPQATVEVYEKQLRVIVAKLKSTGAKLIFATTTFVPDGPQKVYRSNADVEKYNAAALRVMAENGVAIDDLYTASKANYQAWQLPVNVHFKPEGSEALAKLVVQSVE